MTSFSLEKLLRAIVLSTLAATSAQAAACGGSGGDDDTGSTSAGPGGQGGSTAGASGSAGTSGGGSAGVAGASGSGGAGASGSAGQAGAGGASGSAGTAGAAGIAGASGSAGSAGSVPIDTTGFEAIACDAPAVPAGIAGQLGVDFFGLWTTQGAVPPNGPPPQPWVPLSSDGEACSTAADKSACQAAVTEATQGGKSSVLNSGHFYYKSLELALSTKGDVVTPITNQSQLLAALGSIDTREKALLWLRYQFQYGHPCSLFLKKTDQGFEVVAEVGINDCPITNEQQKLLLTPDGKLTVLEKGPQSGGGGCAGRRPEGLWPGRVDGRDELGAMLARQGYLEAASVDAFHRLSAELASLGAPPDLLAACVSAADDEVRHAEAMARLAARHGAAFGPPLAASARKRSPLEIALENEIEGCVRETFGAAVAAWQAERAGDAEVREAMRVIADDEARHAALSWRIGELLAHMLDPEGRRAMGEARARAIDELERELTRSPSPAVASAAGLPTAPEALSLLAALRQQVWSLPQGSTRLASRGACSQ